MLLVFYSIIITTYSDEKLCGFRVLRRGVSRQVNFAENTFAQVFERMQTGRRNDFVFRFPVQDEQWHGDLVPILFWIVIGREVMGFVVRIFGHGRVNGDRVSSENRGRHWTVFFCRVTRPKPLNVIIPNYDGKDFLQDEIKETLLYYPWKKWSRQNILL